MLTTETPEKATPINPAGVTIKRRSRYFVFVFFLTLTFSQSMDQGALSGNTKDLKHYFHINDGLLGTLGSIVFIGNTIGCILTFTLINRINRKYILLGASAITTVCAFTISQSRSFYLVLACRLISGATQAFCGIYSPVWIDQYGVFKNRSLFMALFQIFSPLGYIAGYVIGMLTYWKIPFYMITSFIGAHIIILVFIKDKFFSRKYHNIKKNPNAEVSGDGDSLFEEKIDLEAAQHFKCSSILQEFCACLKSPIFVLANCSLTMIYFVVSGIQFWINDYLELSLGIHNKKRRLYIFAIIIITSPILGIILGGVFVKAIFGGYDKKNTILFPLCCAIVVTVVSNFIIMTLNIWVFAVTLWLYLFFGSMMLPGMNGIVINSVPKEFAGNASALSTLIYNCLGKFPSPNVYGFIKQKTGPRFGGRIPMTVTVNFAFLGLVFLVIATIVKYRTANKKKNEKIIFEETTEKGDMNIGINDTESENTIK